MFRNKAAIACMMVFLLAFQSLEASARVGGSRSGSSMSSSRSHVTQSSVAPQRAGSGNDAGMQRPDVMNKARSQDAAAPVTQPAPQAAGATPAAGQPAKPGFGVGSMVGAAAAGAAVGYLANSAMHDNAAPQTQAGSSDHFANPLASGGQSGGSGFPWGGILMLLAGTAAVIGVLTFLSRRRETADLSTYGRVAAQSVVPASTVDAEQQSFEANALKFFNALQEANNRGDIAYMEQNSIDPMRQVLVDDIRNRAVPSQTQVMMMKAERIDLTEESDRSIASVRFRGMVSENENAAPDSIDEVWHFIRSRDADSRWMLAGIEQV
jgi:hypothetical protein